jgi:hypothetical protein
VEFLAADAKRDPALDQYSTASTIVAQIRFSLRVPIEAIASVIAASQGIVEQDFRKSPTTPERIWAETCYMRWWLSQGHGSGEDAIFFNTESFAYSKLLNEFENISSNMAKWKSRDPVINLYTAGLPQQIKDLHNRISRLVACYLIYRNGSNQH